MRKQGNRSPWAGDRRGGRWCISVVSLFGIVGCGGDARVSLSAADALTTVAAQVRTTLDEYQNEVRAYDDGRERAMVRAFVERVRRDATDDSTLDQHSAEFEAAMTKLRADRQTEWTRRTAAETHVDAILEIAAGLRRVAIESLTLQDEMRRYLYTWTQKQANAGQGTAAPSGS